MIVRRELRIVLVAALLAAACSPGEAAIEPPEIAYGQVLCDHCGMLIDEPRFAAALILEDRQTRQFDDIGDMLAFAAEDPGLQVRAWFVHDYDTGIWLSAEGAFFVIDPLLMTPMGSGIAAFEQREAAGAFAAEHGLEVLRFADLRAGLGLGAATGQSHAH